MGDIRECECLTGRKEKFPGVIRQLRGHVQENMKLTLGDLNNLGVLGELEVVALVCFSVAGYIKVQNAGTGDFR